MGQCTFAIFHRISLMKCVFLALHSICSSAGIMVSDFIDEHNGFLALTDEEHDAAKVLNPRIHKYARQFLEYGESKGGVLDQGQIHCTNASSNRDCRD